jgi:hypothetical protein
MKPANRDKIEVSGSYSSQTLSLFQVEGMPASLPPAVELTAEGDGRAYPARPECTLDTQCGDCACE